MRILNRDFDFEEFYTMLKQDGPKLLLLDYDGTLAPFHEDPKQAVPYPGIPALLNEILSTSQVRLVIISGRAIHDLQPLLNLDQPIEIWGTHGHERLLPSGSYMCTQASINQTEGMQAAIQAVEEIEPSIQAERKPGAVAFHWRSLPAERIKHVLEHVRSTLNDIATSFDLELKRFNEGLEIQIPGVNKGQAVREVLMDVTPQTPIAYLGDDLTDEDAFWELKYKGLSVLVGPTLRTTQADLWLKPPEELMWFLEKWTSK